MKDKIETPREAFLYLTDCALITVSDMVMLGRSKEKAFKHEYLRHLETAQNAIDLVTKFDMYVNEYSRIYEVITHNNKSVKLWLEMHESNDK